MCCILFKNWTNWGLCYKWQSFLCIICLINRFSTVGWYLLFFADVDKLRANRQNKCWHGIFLHITDMLKLFLCLFAVLWSRFTFWEVTKWCLWCGEVKAPPQKVDVVIYHKRGWKSSTLFKWCCFSSASWSYVTSEMSCLVTTDTAKRPEELLTPL